MAAGCGRLGFDDVTEGPGGDAGGDACAPGACGAFIPEAGNCLAADRGPFLEVGAIPTEGAGYGLWAAPPFLLAAETTGGLRSLRFDGTTFQQVGQLDALGWVEAVWSDGPYLYVGAPGTGLAVVRIATDGQLSLLTQNTTTLVEARRGWVSDGVIYVPTGPGGLHAARFDGVTLSQVGTPVPSMSWAQGAWARGARVLFADADRFRVLDFDGATFTDVVPPDARHPGSTRVWSDGVTMFVANADGATAFRLDGATLVELDAFATSGPARDIWSDGQHVFVATEDGTLSALAFDADRFALLDQVTTGASTLGVFGDGTYVYANDFTGGVRAYAGFACTSW